MVAKPGYVFDRDREWEALARPGRPGRERPRMGVVGGRRRTGKTFLLEAFVQQMGGFYFGATEATETVSLRRFSEALGAYLSAPAPPRFDDWEAAIGYLFSDQVAGRGPFVIDEFPFLSKASPSLPSVLAHAVDRAAFDRRQITLLLCGSAMSVMGRLLAGNAPLRGRAALELILRPFEYRLAARFWEAEHDPRLAFHLHSIVGGTPAYRQFVDEDLPGGMDDFDDWVKRTVLNPSIPLFREARYLLEEEPAVRDTALYHSVLSAVAQGNSTRGGVAGYVGRKAADLGHPLHVLEDCGLLRREGDLFRSGRSQYRVAEPLITFYHAVMERDWGFLESGRADTVWPSARSHFTSQVLGPHFEEICRQYAGLPPFEKFADLPNQVGAGVITDPKRHTQIEIDVAVLAAPDPGRPRRVLSLGEAKWGKVMGVQHVERLRRAQELLTERGYDTRDTVLACYSGTGFEPTLQQEAEDDNHVLLADLDTLYRDPDVGM